MCKLLARKHTAAVADVHSMLRHSSKYRFVFRSQKILFVTVPLVKTLPQFSTSLPLSWIPNDVRDALINGGNCLAENFMSGVSDPLLRTMYCHVFGV
jgi:hypothetical protein